MPKLIFFLCLGLGYFVSTLSFVGDVALAEESLVGRIQLESRSFNFGTVSEGESVEHEFKFKNTGNADLQIVRVVSSCGCTAGVVSNEPIPPGVENSIKVVFDSTGFSGRIVKQVKVYTTDQSNKELTLSLEGEVDKLVKLVPNKLDFAKIVSGVDLKAKDLEIRIKPGSDKKFKNLKSYSKYLKIKQLASRQDSASAELVIPFSIELDPKVPQGLFRDRLLVEFTDSKSGSVINVPVLAQIEGPVSVEPKQISFGLIQGDSPQERKVRIENRSKEPLEITSISSDNRAIDVESKVIEPGSLFVLTFKLNPKEVKSDLRALVKIETSLPDYPEILVSVFGVVAPKKN